MCIYACVFLHIHTQILAHGGQGPNMLTIITNNQCAPPTGLRLLEVDICCLSVSVLSAQVLTLLRYCLLTDEWMKDTSRGRDSELWGTARKQSFRNLSVFAACWHFQNRWADFRTLHSSSRVWTISAEQPRIYWIHFRVCLPLSYSAPRFQSSFSDVKLRPGPYFYNLLSNINTLCPITGAIYTQEMEQSL